MIFQQILKKAAADSRKLFLIDSLGALLSALLYGVVLANLESVFGMPPKILYGLSFMAGLYAIYSGICYFLNLKNWQPFLKIIALANLFHCHLTIGLVFFHFQKITLLGLLYFVGELILVVSLAIIEWKTASR